MRVSALVLALLSLVPPAATAAILNERSAHLDWGTPSTNALGGALAAFSLAGAGAGVVAFRRHAGKPTTTVAVIGIVAGILLALWSMMFLWVFRPG